MFTFCRTVTARQVRAKLEEDLKVPEGTLRPERKYIEKLLIAVSFSLTVLQSSACIRQDMHIL